MKLPLRNTAGCGLEARIVVLISADGVGYVRLLAAHLDRRRRH